MLDETRLAPEEARGQQRELRHWLGPPEVNRARAKIPTPRQKQTDKFKEIKEMYLRQNAQLFE